MPRHEAGYGCRCEIEPELEKLTVNAGAPHVGFSLAVRRISSVISGPFFGRPPVARLFQGQNSLKPLRCQPVAQNARSTRVSLGRFVSRFKMANCYRKARFSRASSRCPLKLDLAGARRAKIRSNMRERELDSDLEIINDCAVYGVLRRHSISFDDMKLVDMLPAQAKQPEAFLELRTGIAREINLGELIPEMPIARQ